MQAQTSGHLRQYRFNRGILIALAGIGLLVASLVGIRLLTDGQSVSQTSGLSPVAAPVVEDPPLPNGWVEQVAQSSVSGVPYLGLDRAAAIDANRAIGFTSDSRFPHAGMDRAAAIEANRSIEGKAVNNAVAGADEIRFIEENLWDNVPPALPAGGADDVSESTPDHSFIKENIWETAVRHPVSPADPTAH